MAPQVDDTALLAKTTEIFRARQQVLDWVEEGGASNIVLLICTLTDFDQDVSVRALDYFSRLVEDPLGIILDEDTGQAAEISAGFGELMRGLTGGTPS